MIFEAHFDLRRVPNLTIELAIPVAVGGSIRLIFYHRCRERAKGEKGVQVLVATDSGRWVSGDTNWCPQSVLFSVRACTLIPGDIITDTGVKMARPAR